MRVIWRALVALQIAIVAWDTLALLEPYGIRRAQADCVAYLTMAHSLVLGRWLQTPAYFEPASHGWVHEWAAGYPAAIAAVSHLTEEEPFYASRWLNIGLYVAYYGLLWVFFSSEAELLFFFVWPPNLTWSVTMALSENLFIPLLVLLVGAIALYERGKKTLGALLAGISLMALFLMRYAGVAMGLAVGLWGLLQAFRGQWKEALLWIGLAGAQAGVAVAYWAWNAANHPQGLTGLTLRNMPMPPDLFWRVLTDITFLRFFLLVALAVLTLRWLRGKPSFTTEEKRQHTFLVLLSVSQLLVYIVSMIQGRVGIVDNRHYALMSLPLLWIAARHFQRTLPPKALLAVGVIFVGWQVRNTYRHYTWAYEKKHLPYTYWEELRQAYDTLPPHTCIVGADMGYPIRGKRTDLCLGDIESYWPVLVRRCSCIYVDCGPVDLRHKLGLSGGIPWLFLRYCDPPCTNQRICLRKAACANSK
ncbi:MAG: hypothetical protein NZ580_06290 [Bacteroidia bacterium]|nr:hypothetical protein [Bacteroidia bacterium]MDW8236467.1 hypothetical protein [Bacteroidia bacterium]